MARRRRLKLIALWVAALLAAGFALTWGLFAALAGSDRALRIAVAQDQAANAAIGGSEDETISSRAGKGAMKGVWHWCLLCRVLNWIDPQHCQQSLEPDEGEPLPEQR
ncbi:hypothetical protein [Pseudogulbenkiania sp. MAI-1]|uniref:hypothetical protein n=1 Tax=Pseudogulbenkiania sp. MAI-1 TaxID=990370 RepID=UPI00045E7E25|nr:hypothetical protein [Pseudogulbenkiania sp. MAI-1]